MQLHKCLQYIRSSNQRQWQQTKYNKTKQNKQVIRIIDITLLEKHFNIN